MSAQLLFAPPLLIDASSSTADWTRSTQGCIGPYVLAGVVSLPYTTEEVKQKRDHVRRETARDEAG